LVFGIYLAIFAQIHHYVMSKEVLEISVNVDEQFDVDFNLVQGLFGFILRFFGK
jgi:hypothetical protein